MNNGTNQRLSTANASTACCLLATLYYVTYCSINNNTDTFDFIRNLTRKKLAKTEDYFFNKKPHYHNQVT